MATIQWKTYSTTDLTRAIIRRLLSRDLTSFTCPLTGGTVSAHSDTRLAVSVVDNALGDFYSWLGYLYLLCEEVGTRRLIVQVWSRDKNKLIGYAYSPERIFIVK